MPTARRPEVPPAAPRGALVVRLCNWVGEVVLSIPALRRLEAAGFELRLVGKRWAPALLEGTGWPVLVRRAGLGAAATQLRELRRALACAGGAAPRALLLTKSLSSAVETRLAGLRAAGYAHDGRSLLLAAAYPLPRFAHAAHAYWHLVSRFLGEDAPYPASVDLVPSPAQDAAARALLAAHGLAARGFVLLCPFSGADDRERRKVWPGFAELAAALDACALPVVVCPGPGEDELAAATLPRALQLKGIDLGVYAALLRIAHTVVANDTGPGHLAAAVGARLVSIYGPQSIAAWAPLGPHVELVHDPAGWPPAARIAASVLGA
jgi:heptosyltransferase II